MTNKGWWVNIPGTRRARAFEQALFLNLVFYEGFTFLVSNSKTDVVSMVPYRCALALAFSPELLAA